MKIRRTIPPAAAPISARALLQGLTGLFPGRTNEEKLEQELKEYFGVRHLFLVSSGKAAFALILDALRSLAPGKRKVLIPAYTCFSVPSAIVKAGLEVSLSDVDQDTFDFDRSQLPRAIRRDTLCVVPTNLLGIPADLKRIRTLCRKKGVFLVEDAAQAMGGSYEGKLLGTIGDVGFFSLGRGKNITCGSGGIIVTNDDRIGAALRQRYAAIEQPRFFESVAAFLKALALALFIHPSQYWFPAGLPFLKLGETVFDPLFPVKRLSGMQAGLLQGWQQRLEESNRIRRANAEYFCHELGWELSKRYPVPFLRLPIIVASSTTRNTLRTLSWEQGLGLGRLYPTAIADIPELASCIGQEAFPGARTLAAGIVTVPTHQLLTPKDKQHIVALLRQVITEEDRSMMKDRPVQEQALPGRGKGWYQQQDHYV